MRSKQDPDGTGSIDFCWKTASGRRVYIEVRLLHQDKATTDSIDRQLQNQGSYLISGDGDSEQKDIIRVQQAVLEKVQKKDGTPRKFALNYKDAINLVAVDISQLILGMFDREDCKLVTLGDPSVDPIYRRGVFGLFQEPKPAYPEHIQSRARHYHHVRETLHGVLFLFRQPRGELFNYSVKRYLGWNFNMISKDSARAICNEIDVALPLAKGP